jgi:hypothetical protein
MECLKGEIYKHLKTGGLYEFVDMGLIEATKQVAVIYRCQNTGQVWIRPVTEFFDGRFECILQNDDKAPKVAPPPSPKPKTTQPIH